MSENTPRVPDLPATSEVSVVKEPPPPQKPHHVKKVKSPKPGDTTTAASGTIAPGSAASPAEAAPTPPATVERKPPVTQASMPVPAATAPSPIGDLTTGSAADAAQTSHQAEDLIRTTREGVQGIKRSLSSDEKKTVAEIWAFLDRAQQALKNGDTDGANGLATKAKLLLDELTQN